MQAQARQRDAQHRLGLGLRQSLDLVARLEVDHEAQFRGVEEGKAKDADAARLDQAAQRRGRRGDEARAPAAQVDAVVGDQRSAAIDEAQREVRLSGAGRAAQQDAGAVDRDAGRMDLDGRGLGHAGGTLDPGPRLVNAPTALHQSGRERGAAARRPDGGARAQPPAAA